MKRDAFTLVEVLVTSAIVVVLALLLIIVTHQTADAGSRAAATAEEFRAAQNAFEAVTQQLSRATLNNLREFRMDGKIPRGFDRASDLRFVSGPMQTGATPLTAANLSTGLFGGKWPGHGVFFQALLGRAGEKSGVELPGRRQLLNTWGYFVEVGDDSLSQPSFLSDTQQYRRIAPRLVELREPAERISLYAPDPRDPMHRGFKWFQDPMGTRNFCRTISSNIAVLLLQPKLPAAVAERIAPSLDRAGRDALLAPEYYYYSVEDPRNITHPELSTRHRLPPLIDVTMVALDDATISRLYGTDNLDPLSLDERFLQASRFGRELYSDPANPGSSSLEDRLISMRARFRIFTTTVALRSAP
jgi:uncharacterized protein (TIGR02599 family)